MWKYLRITYVWKSKHMYLLGSQLLAWVWDQPADYTSYQLERGLSASHSLAVDIQMHPGGSCNA